MILSISDVFWSGVGAQVTVDGSVLAVLNIPPALLLIEEIPVKVLLLWVIILVSPLFPPLVDVVENLLWSSLDVAVDDVGKFMARDVAAVADDFDFIVDFNSNCNSSHLTVSKAAYISFSSLMWAIDVESWRRGNILDIYDNYLLINCLLFLFVCSFLI
jgi:hypothetical protein